MTPLFFLFGYARIKISEAYTAEALNICMYNSIEYARFSSCDDGYSSFCVSKKDLSRLVNMLSDRGIAYDMIDEGGAFARLGRYKRRWGIILGAVLFVCILVTSELFLWEIKIEGLESVPEQEIRELLSKKGVRVGTRISGIDPDKLQNDLLIESDDISWISVNLSGTVANVEVRERKKSEAAENEWDAANLVAARSGTVVLFSDVRGNAVTEIGEAVSEGQLLVSGIYGSEEVGFRFTVARGKVFAETEREFSVEIPLEYEKKVPTGREWCEKYLVFFEKEIKIFSNYRNSGTSCDTIYIEMEEEYDTPHVLDGRRLPFGIKTVRYVEYESAVSQREPSVASGLARYEMGKAVLAALGDDGELLEQSFGESLTDRAYVLTSKIRCIENIAIQKEIKIEK